MVALVCYANAAIRNGSIPWFFPDNSTCQFCDWVIFVGARLKLLAIIKIGLCPARCRLMGKCMPRAAMSAWVFGGMGLWNDLGFDGADGQEYERVSETLFTIINEAIEIAA